MTAKLTALKPYEPDWEHGYCTRDGRQARVICTDALGVFPVIALVRGDIDGEEWPENYRSDGVCYRDKEGPSNLMCAAPRRTDPRYVFIVEDAANRLSAPWPSRQRAQQHIDECDERFPELSPRKILRFVQDQEDAA